MLLTPTTELEAVNQMLSDIGESPVNSVEDNGVVDAVMARALLRSVSRRVQARGWHFNTDKRLVLARTFPDKTIVVPANALKVDTVGRDACLDVVLRGTKLYDRVKHSYTFDRDVIVDLVSFLDWPELTETARSYITIAACRKFQEDRVGSDTLSAFNRRDELLAWADLQTEEADNLDLNMLDDALVIEVMGR